MFLPLDRAIIRFKLLSLLGSDLSTFYILIYALPLIFHPLIHLSPAGMFLGKLDSPVGLPGLSARTQLAGTSIPMARTATTTRFIIEPIKRPPLVCVSVVWLCLPLRRNPIRGCSWKLTKTFIE